MERPYHSHKQLSRRRTKWRKVNYLSCVHETSDAAFSVRVNDLICVDARNGTLLKRNREQLPGARISAEHEARTALHSADRHQSLLPPTSIDHLAGRAFLWSRLLDLRPFHQGNDFY